MKCQETQHIFKIPILNLICMWKYEAKSLVFSPFQAKTLLSDIQVNFNLVSYLKRSPQMCNNNNTQTYWLTLTWHREFQEEVRVGSLKLGVISKQVFQVRSLDENKHGHQCLEVQRHSMVWHTSQTSKILFSYAFTRLYFV